MPTFGKIDMNTIIIGNQYGVIDFGSMDILSDIFIADLVQNGETRISTSLFETDGHYYNLEFAQST
jgi:hypothetical protein